MGSNWPKGVSGNPSGRPKNREKALVDIGERLVLTADTADALLGDLRACRADRAPVTAWVALVERAITLALSPSTEPRDVVALLKVLLPYRYGLPKQKMDIDVTSDAPRTIDWSKVPIEKRRELLAAAAELDAIAEEPASDTEH
jgi:hypothetical protein